MAFISLGIWWKDCERSAYESNGIGNYDVEVNDKYKENVREEGELLRKHFQRMKSLSKYAFDQA